MVEWWYRSKALRGHGFSWGDRVGFLPLGTKPVTYLKLLAGTGYYLPVDKECTLANQELGLPTRFGKTEGLYSLNQR